MSRQRSEGGDDPAELLRQRLGGSIASAPGSRLRRRGGGSTGTSADVHKGRTDYVTVKANLLARLLARAPADRPQSAPASLRGRWR